MSAMKCARCSNPPANGVSVDLYGPATGFRMERWLLCEDCLVGFRDYLAGKFAFLTGEHVRLSDEYTPAGAAHIACCPECTERMGGTVAPVIINKQRVAERFARKGLAQ